MATCYNILSKYGDFKEKLFIMWQQSAIFSQKQTNYIVNIIMYRWLCCAHACVHACVLLNNTYNTFTNTAQYNTIVCTFYGNNVCKQKLIVDAQMLIPWTSQEAPKYKLKSLHSFLLEFGGTLIGLCDVGSGFCDVQVWHLRHACTKSYCGLMKGGSK